MPDGLIEEMGLLYVSSGHRTRELDGHGRVGVICGAMECVCYWLEVWSDLAGREEAVQCEI